MKPEASFLNKLFAFFESVRFPFRGFAFVEFFKELSILFRELKFLKEVRPIFPCEG